MSLVEALARVEFPIVGDLSVLTNVEVIAARAHLARLRAECDSWSIAIAGVTAARSGRDASATLCREMGVSVGRSYELLDAAAACAENSVVNEAVKAGRLGAERARALKGLSGEAATRVIHEHSSATVNEFRSAAQTARIDETAGHDRARRQRAHRGVTFFDGPDGCIGIRAVLPTLDGARVKKRLQGLADAAYRAQFPERAKTLDGHEADGWRSRLADALVELAIGDAPASGKPAVVIVVDEARLSAEVINEGPIPFCDVADLIKTTKVDLYSAVRGTKGEILSFGRSRRFASLIQRLALLVRDGGTCTQPGCTAPWDRCHTHHRVPFDEGGPTDLVNLEHECSAHHHHEHQHQGDHIDDTGPPSMQSAA
jgi:hypothetical protein